MKFKVLQIIKILPGDLCGVILSVKLMDFLLFLGNRWLLKYQKLIVCMEPKDRARRIHYNIFIRSGEGI